ncbi:MAG: hypothetical protein IH971_11175, partial [Candidatus Marinimicrobia bacterium]|nr:hypothetical protein [Candidatus Neomarinimicrobiota bacterium]
MIGLLNRIPYYRSLVLLLVFSPLHGQAGPPALTDIPEIVLTTPQGHQRIGKVLYAMDTSLVLWGSKDSYNHYELSEFAQLVPYYSLEQIVVVNKGHFVRGLVGGGLIGGAAGAALGAIFSSDGGFISPSEEVLLGAIFLGAIGGSAGGLIGAIRNIDDRFPINGNPGRYREALPWLRRYVLFPHDPPDELQAWIDGESGRDIAHSDNLQPPGSRLPGSAQSVSLKTASETRRFQISFGFAWIEMSANNNIFDAFSRSGFSGTEAGFFSSTDYPRDLSLPFASSIGLEYDINNRFRVGLMREPFPKTDIEGIDGERESLVGASYI